jgi:tetratricopeptide (TPR) repeat protein
MMRTFPLPQSLLLVASFLILMALCAHAQTFSVRGIEGYKQANDFEGMRNYATAWTRAEPNNGYAWFGLGMADFYLNNDTEAISSMRHAIGISPDNTVFYNNLAAVYARRGHVQSALVILDKEGPAAQKANDSHIWYILGNGYLKIKAARDAAAMYTKALTLAPDFGACWTNLGVALELAGDTNGAMTAYNHGKALGNDLGGHNADYLKQEIARAAADAARCAAENTPAHRANIDYRLRQIQMGNGQ